jgi:hypothetical protein
MRVHNIQVVFSGAHTTQWAYTAKGWTRPGSNAEPGHDFIPDNILLLRVRIGDAGYLDPAGNPVPRTYFYGNGPGLLVHDAHAQKVVWHKPDEASTLTLTTPSGHDVTVPAGHTWIELVPRTGASVQLGH